MGVGLVLLPVIWIVLMVLSPAVLQVSSTVVEPVAKLLDRTSGAMFPQDAGEAELFWVVLSPLLSFLTVVFVHEMGHVALGLLADFRLIYVRVGPLRISPPLRISWTSPSNRRPVGITYFVPSHVRNLRRRTILMVLGGPLANLASGLLVILLQSKLSVFSGWFVSFSIFIGIGNLIPIRRLGLISDGKRILMLLRKRYQGERWLAIMQLGADLTNGVAPEDLRSDLLTMATAAQDDSPDTVAAYALAYSAAYFQRRYDEAAVFLEVCLKYVNFGGAIMREAIFCDAGVFQARRRNRPDLAAQWLGEIPEKVLFPGSRLRIEAAILESQRDFQGAVGKLEEVEKAILTDRNNTHKDLSVRLLHRWKSELLEKISGSPERII